MKSEPTMPAARCRPRNPSQSVAAVVGTEKPDVGAEQHHPLEADVEHAGTLGDRLAERGEHQRHAGEDPARDQRWSEDSVLI